MTPNDGPQSPTGPPRAEGGHLTPEELDDLAARASADLDPDQPEERDADITALEQHLAGCAACRSALGDQVEVSAWLRRAPDAGPMPADVVARLDAALAGAAEARRPASAAAGTAGRTVLPMSGRVGRTSVIGRLAESRLTKSLVAAAAVVLIGAGGFAALHRSHEPSAGDSAASAGSANGAQKGAAIAPQDGLAQVQVRESGTKYTTDNVIDEVKRQLAGAVTTGGPAAGLSAASAGTLTSPAGLAACLNALQVGAVRPQLVDLATYNGKPAAILVLPSAGGGQDIWVVARTCGPGPGKDGTMLFKRLG